MKKESRAMTRRHIFNIIFRFSFLKDYSAEDMLNDYYDLLEYEKDYQLEHDEEDEILAIDFDFIRSEVNGVIKNINEIDEVIEKYIVGWTMERLASVDIAILRIAVYEILFDESIPAGVSANEAVELAKEYSGEKSPSFINGIISNVIKNEKERV